ncbi:MAG TPA: right-handed parallel beta-helix repeat-containing protein [Vicinamibacterales bacterium]|nr:right-handed parallel beta-helix repeat-containing protein [Vicinamibacterales bacterium]
MSRMVRSGVYGLVASIALLAALPASAGPVLSVSATSVTVQGTAGSDAPAATMQVINSGNGALKWSVVAPAAGWLSVSPASGTNTKPLTLTFGTSGLAAGQYQTSFDVTSGSSRVTVYVQVNLVTPAALPPPPVAPPPPTATQLFVTCPANASVTSLDGGAVVVNYSATTDGGVAPISVTGNPASGSAFPVGTTSVTVKAQSSDGQTSYCSFSVTVAYTAAAAPPPPPPPPPPSTSAVGPQSTIVCPAGAIDIWPGQYIQGIVNSYPGATTFCLRAGVHSLTSSITPKTGNTFVGEYGAILDGTGYWPVSDDTQAAFRAHNQDIDYVTIRNLVIRDMPFSGIHTYYWMSDHWTIEYNEIAANKIGIEFSPNFIIRNNYIHHNVGNASSSNPAERGGGYQGFRADNTTFDSNEIAYNGPEQKVGISANVAFRNNFVHHNLRDGIWYDTNPNGGSVIDGNRVEDNARIGIVFESSVGVTISNNTVRRNAGDGIFISMSQNAQIYSNTLDSNFGGIEYFLNCDSLSLGEDVKNNTAHDNTIVASTQAYGYVSGFSYLSSCSSTQLAAYLNGSKNLTFSRNAYKVPSVSSRYWLWGGWKYWNEWQAMGQDAGGSVSQ